MEVEREGSIKQADVVVIGGGLAGLSAACYLARAGIDVMVFEKSASLGGRAASQLRDGYTFNRGIHALYTGGPASEVLAELGIAYSGHPPKDISVLNEGQLHIAPINTTTLLRTSVLSFADKLELMKVLAGIAGLQPETLRNMSVEEWLLRNLRRPQVRKLLAAQARTFVYSSALELVSADVFLKKMQISLKNPVLYLDGGWQVLVDGLRVMAERAGARILNNARVESVMREEEKVTGVLLHNGETIKASTVLIATPPQEAVKLVDDGNYQPLRKIVDSLVPARVACLDVALSRLPDARYPVVQDLDGPRFLSAQSVYSRIAPQGSALIHTFKQLDSQHMGDPREHERDLENLLDMVQPGWRDVLIRRVYLPHIEAVGMLPTIQSNGYAGRPGQGVPGIHNLYLAGDWIGEGFLSDPSFGSARQVAQTIITSKKAC